MNMTHDDIAIILFLQLFNARTSCKSVILLNNNTYNIIYFPIFSNNENYCTNVSLQSFKLLTSITTPVQIQ